jgi:hypothetical protein
MLHAGRKEVLLSYERLLDESDEEGASWEGENMRSKASRMRTVNRLLGVLISLLASFSSFSAVSSSVEKLIVLAMKTSFTYDIQFVVISIQYSSIVVNRD